MPTYNFVWTGQYNPWEHVDRTFPLAPAPDNLLTTRADCSLFLKSHPGFVPTAPNLAPNSAPVNGAIRVFGLRWTNVRKRTRILGGSIHLVEKKNHHATADIPAMSMSEDVNGEIISLPWNYWHRSPVWFHCFATITVESTDSQTFTPSPIGSVARHCSSDPDWLLTEHPNDVQFLFPHENVSLWANSRVLKSVSPYFVMLLSSSVSEEAKRTVLGSQENTLRNEKAVVGTDEIEMAEVAESSEEGEDWENDDDSDGEQEVDKQYALPSPKEPEESPICSVPAHRIKVTQTRAVTYQALLRWILTGRIDFAPLRSQVAWTGTGKALQVVGGPALVSPKSVYRLAHLLENKELQDLALKSFESQVSVENCAVELYSEFCGTYAEPREIVLELAVDNWRSVKGCEEMKEILDHLHEGKYRHHQLIAAELLKRL